MKFKNKNLFEVKTGEIKELKTKNTYPIYIKDLNNDGIDKIIIYTKGGKRVDIKNSIGYGYIINDKIYEIKGRFYRIYAGSGKFGI